MHTYKRTETALWTVGHYAPDGEWIPESDHGDPDAAADRAILLNGGTPPPRHTVTDFRTGIDTTSPAAVAELFADIDPSEALAVVSKACEIVHKRAFPHGERGFIDVRHISVFCTKCGAPWQCGRDDCGRCDEDTACCLGDGTVPGDGDLPDLIDWDVQITDAPGVAGIIVTCPDCETADEA